MNEAARGLLILDTDMGQRYPVVAIYQGKNAYERKALAMRKTILTMTVMTMFLFGGLCGASFADKSVPKQTAKKPAVKSKTAAATTVFDMGHTEIFSPVKEGPLNYSTFHDIWKQSGEEVGLNKEAVTAARLSKVKTYIIAGPVQSFTREEVAALESFVKNGGNLLVLLHIAPPVAQLTNSFGILVSNFTIGETAGLIDNKSQDFFVTNFGAHPVSAGLEKIAVYGTWGLMANEPAMTVAATSAKAWADMDRNRKFDKGEPQQEFGIVAVSQTGKGKVVVVADDAPFANKFIGEADNRRLAENIIRWFKQ